MKLDSRFLVPGPTAGTILLAPDGSLPAAQLEGDEQEAAVVPVTTFLREAWRLGSPVLETHPKWKDAGEGEPIPTLVLTEPASVEWSPPSGLAFAPFPSVALGGLPAPLRPRQ